MLNDRRCPLNSSAEWPTFTDITISSAAGERSACEAIRVRGRCRDSEPGGNAPSPRLSPRTRGEGAELFFPCRSVARRARAHAYARNPTIAHSIGRSPPRGGNVILTASCRYDSMLS
jgi:hypothetical protein